MLYKVLLAHSPEELSNLVTRDIALGWQPQGGLAMTINSATSGGTLVQVRNDLVVNIAETGNNLLFGQAMVKYGD